MKGSTFLKVMGIICIIFGAIGLISGFMSVASAQMLSALGIGGGMGSAVLSLLSAIVMLIAGILGVTNCKKPEKAMTNVVLGVLMLILAIIGIILSVKLANDAANYINDLYSSVGLDGAGSGLKGVSALSILGLVIPVLYLIPALQLKSNNTGANYSNMQ